MKIYEVFYRCGSGGIRDVCREYYRAENLLTVLKSVEEEFDITIDPDDYDIDNDKIVIDGQFCDGIIRGGDWIYYDLEIFPVDPDTIPLTVKLTYKELKLTDTELANFIRSSYNNPLIITLKNNVSV